MDSVTQILLGASVAAICAPKEHRPKALAVGAALGTLPDLDVVIDYGNVVDNFTYHRGFSHSLFVLAPFSVALWWVLKRSWSVVQDAPRPWFFAITLSLITHPLLDAHTVYGTQLFWPIPVNPTMWSTLFIIDPSYTLPLLIGVIGALFWPTRAGSNRILITGFVLSQLYLGWTWTAKSLVDRDIKLALETLGIEDAQYFSTPTPFNTLMWRVVILTEEGYLEGIRSLPVDKKALRLSAWEFDRGLLDTNGHIGAATRLRWFASEFVSAEVREQRLVISDLRMGASHPNYVFRHVVAGWRDGEWQAVTPERLDFAFAEDAFDSQWDRLWNEPD